MSREQTTSISGALAVAIRGVTERPIFTGARFGLAVHDVVDGRPIYRCNAQDLFQAASTTKNLTAAYALSLLGRDFRFRTRLVRTGMVDGSGTLHGDLVLIGSGDPNLSGRVTSNDTLDFQAFDHSVGGPKAQLVERNPLQIIEAFARGVREAGIRRVTGTVLVDVQLFPEGYREPGTGTIVSPIAVNDNLIDIEVKAGERAGERLSYRITPASGYVRFIDRATTAPKDAPNTLRFSNEQRQADATWSVVISGSVPVGTTSWVGFAVQSPSRFARTLLVEALASAGVVVEGGLLGSDITSTATSEDRAVVFEHVSPPLVEATKVILKVSQNLHAEMLLPVIGATVRGTRGPEATAAGYECASQLLARWGVDMTGACQGDAAGMFGYFSPDFMCRLLARIASSDIYGDFASCLPVMGRDGTIRDVQRDSPAAEHVVAKTGTIISPDRLYNGLHYGAKGLAGYATTKSGRRVAFAIYLNDFYPPPSSDVDPGEVLGEVATAIYQCL
jgi:PBP4 family serine-type D-alanyl-D-alanine carboxypeptidase